MTESISILYANEYTLCLSSVHCKVAPRVDAAERHNAILQAIKMDSETPPLSYLLPPLFFPSSTTFLLSQSSTLFLIIHLYPSPALLSLSKSVSPFPPSAVVPYTLPPTP